MIDIIVEKEPSSATDNRLLQVHAYWSSIRINEQPPNRSDFDPADIPDLLPNIFLVDVLSNPRDFRFRLVGTAFLQATTRDLTGLRITEAFPPEFSSQVLAGWNNVVENGGPNWARGQVWQKEREFIAWQGVILPFRSPSGQALQMLGGAVFSIGNKVL
jgi:hypothetical protein